MGEAFAFGERFLVVLEQLDQFGAQGQQFGQTTKDRLFRHLWPVGYPGSVVSRRRSAPDLFDFLSGHDVKLLTAVFEAYKGIGATDITGFAGFWWFRNSFAGIRHMFKSCSGAKPIRKLVVITDHIAVNGSDVTVAPGLFGDPFVIDLERAVNGSVLVFARDQMRSAPVRLEAGLRQAH